MQIVTSTINKISQIQQIKFKFHEMPKSEVMRINERRGFTRSDVPSETLLAIKLICCPKAASSGYMLEFHFSVLFSGWIAQVPRNVHTKCRLRNTCISAYVNVYLYVCQHFQFT